MKKRSILTALALTLLMVISCFSSVFAEGYGYTVTIYAGKQGSFADGSKVQTFTVTQGEDVDIMAMAADKGFKVTNDEYYFRGFRETGHDNDESPSLIAFKADEDVSYEAAYGIAGGMVKYTIVYVDEDGASVRDSDTYYGMVGDKPVVSYKYVDGYQPNAYNLTKKLVADESQNVFEFSYTANPEGAAEGDGATDGQAGARNAADGQNANANAGANAANADANANAPATIVDLDDNATPQAETAGGATDIAETDAPKAGISPVAIGGGVVALAAIAAAAVAIIRRRSEYEDDDDEDDEQEAQSSNKHVYAQE